MIAACCDRFCDTLAIAAAACSCALVSPVRSMFARGLTPPSAMMPSCISNRPRAIFASVPAASRCATELPPLSSATRGLMPYAFAIKAILSLWWLYLFVLLSSFVSMAAREIDLLGGGPAAVEKMYERLGPSKHLDSPLVHVPKRPTESVSNCPL